MILLLLSLYIQLVYFVLAFNLTALASFMITY